MYLRDLTNLSDDHAALLLSTSNQDEIFESKREMLEWWGGYFYSDVGVNVGAVKYAQEHASRMGVRTKGNQVSAFIPDGLNDDGTVFESRETIPRPH
jgi:hypothetical protein